MFRILDLFRESDQSVCFYLLYSTDPMVVANRQQCAGNEDISEISASAPGERLVRVPLDELQTDTTNS